MSGSNGKGNGWKTISWIKNGQMAIADIIGNITEVLFLKYQDKIDSTLPFLKTGFKTVMYTPMKILQPPVEWLLDKFPSIEGKEAHDKRILETPEKRLEGLLDTGYHYTSAIGVGWSSLVLAEKGLSRLTIKSPNMPKELPARMWWLVDLPVHLGTMAFLGTKMMQPVTGNMKDFSKKLMLASGWTEEKAEQDSRFAVAYILPNYLTLLPTTMMMRNLYHAKSKGLINDIGKPTKSWLGFDSHEHHFVGSSKEATTEEFGIMGKGMLQVAEKLGIIGNPTQAKTASH